MGWRRPTSGSLHLTSDVDTRRLRSANTATLVVLSTDHCTLGDRAFPVASARAWNSLPPSVRNASSLMSFRRNLKTDVLFRSSLSNYSPARPFRSQLGLLFTMKKSVFTVQFYHINCLQKSMSRSTTIIYVLSLIHI